MPNWDPDKYLKYKEERTMPCRDLAAKIECVSPKSVLDVGCGPGNSTFVLKGRFPSAQIVGIDNSPEMIKKARQTYPDMDFKQFDAAENLKPLGRFDVVFSNACLQWIPDNKTALINMFSALNPGGCLAVQVPMIYKEPIHLILSRLIKTDKWRRDFADFKEPFCKRLPEEYFDILSCLTEDFTMWQTVYMHRMNSYKEILDWYSGAGMRPYLQQLDEKDTADFMADALAGIKTEYEMRRNAQIIFRFPRLFFIATKH